MNSIAIVIVTWNSSDLIEKVMVAIQDQSLKPNRILIIDNNSDDIKSLESIVNKYLSVELLKLDTNLGFAAANNIGIRRCDGMDYIALLNPDAFPESSWLEVLLKTSLSIFDAAAFGSRLLSYHNPSKLDGAGDFFTISGKPGRRGHGENKSNNFLQTERVFSVCAAAALYKRDALLDVGGFDEDYFCYVEDTDLGFRLNLKGCKSIYVSDAVVYHVGSSTTGGQHSNFSIYYGHRNLVWTYIKNMPGILFYLLMPLHILLSILAVIWFTIKGQGRVIVKSKWDAIKGIPMMWRKRKKVQAGRTVGTLDIWRLLNKRLLNIRKQ